MIPDRCPECGEKTCYSVQTDVFFCHCGWDEELAALERA